MNGLVDSKPYCSYSFIIESAIPVPRKSNPNQRILWNDFVSVKKAKANKTKMIPARFRSKIGSSKTIRAIIMGITTEKRMAPTLKDTPFLEILCWYTRKVAKKRIPVKEPVIISKLPASNIELPLSTKLKIVARK